MAYDIFSGEQTSRDWSCGDIVDPIIWTPGTIEALKNEVDALMKSLTADVVTGRTAKKINDNTFVAVKDFVARWTTFRDSIGFFAKLTGATVSQLQRFRAEGVAWREKIGKLGVAISSPDPVASSRPGAGLGSGLTSTIKWLGIGAVAIGGGFALTKLFTVINTAQTNKRVEQ